MEWDESVITFMQLICMNLYVSVRNMMIQGLKICPLGLGQSLKIEQNSQLPLCWSLKATQLGDQDCVHLPRLTDSYCMSYTSGWYLGFGGPVSPPQELA